MKEIAEIITALTEFKKTLIKPVDALEATHYKAMKDTIDKKIMELINKL